MTRPRRGRQDPGQWFGFADPLNIIPRLRRDRYFHGTSGRKQQKKAFFGLSFKPATRRWSRARKKHGAGNIFNL